MFFAVLNYKPTCASHEDKHDPTSPTDTVNQSEVTFNISCNGIYPIHGNSLFSSLVLYFVVQSQSEVSADFASSYAGVPHASVQTAHHPKGFVVYKNKMRRVQEKISAVLSIGNFPKSQWKSQGKSRIKLVS